MTRGRPNNHSGVLTHGDRYVLCAGCHQPRSRKNIRSHFRYKHPESADLPSAEMFREIRSTPGAELVPVPAAAALEEVPGLGVEDVDQIVIAVVGQVIPSGMIPVAHLAAFLAWREATAVFLRAVSR